MTGDFQILPDRGIVYVRFGGVIDFDACGALFAAYTRHPDFRPGQKHLCDLAGVTGIDPDFPRLIALQASKAASMALPAGETLMVYYAPTPLTDRIARMILRSWDGIPGVVVGAVNDEAAALAFLGQREDRFADLLARAVS